MSDDGRGSNHLGENPLLDTFFDVIPHASFQPFTVFSPEAGLDAVKMPPEGVERGFQAVSVCLGTDLEVVYLNK